MDCWVNLNGERTQGLQEHRESQKCVILQDNEGHQERWLPRQSENSWAARIAAFKDQWGDNSHCSKSRCVRWHTACVWDDTQCVCVPVHCHTSKRVEKTVSCSVWMRILALRVSIICLLNTSINMMKSQSLPSSFLHTASDARATEGLKQGDFCPESGVGVKHYIRKACKGSLLSTVQETSDKWLWEPVLGSAKLLLTHDALRLFFNTVLVLWGGWELPPPQTFFCPIPWYMLGRHEISSYLELDHAHATWKAQWRGKRVYLVSSSDQLSGIEFNWFRLH